jgi:hypothetical protein
MHHVFIAQLKSNAIAKLFLNPPIHLLGRGDIVRELLNHATTSSGGTSEEHTQRAENTRF